MQATTGNVGGMTSEPPSPAPDSLPTNHHSVDAPDLTSYRAVHDAMRRSNERLVRAVGATVSGDVNRLVALAHWFDGYRSEICNHHDGEDHIVFPALARKAPGFEEYRPALARDHERLDVVLDDLAASLAGWAMDASSRDLQARSLDLAVELHDLLDAHLDVEDREILPMVECFMTAAEYAAVNDEIVRSLGLGQALFTIPWFAEAVDPDVARRLMAEAPLMPRVLHRATRRRYARLLHAAFGGIA